MGIKNKSGLPEEQCLALLRTQVEGDEHIVKSGLDIDDKFLLAFLRGRKYDITYAYETIQKFAHVRKKTYRKFFNGLSPLTFLYIYEIPRFMGFLKYRNEKGHIVAVMKPTDISLLRNPEDILAIWILMLEELLFYQDVVSKGITIIAKGEGFGFALAKEFTPSRIKMAVDICLHAFPHRFKKLHLVNCPSVLGWVIGVIKTFLPKKLRDRMIFHKNQESLLEIFPREALPNWLGGNHAEENEMDVYDFDVELDGMDKYDDKDDMKDKEI